MDTPHGKILAVIQEMIGPSAYILTIEDHGAALAMLGNFPQC